MLGLESIVNIKSDQAWLRQAQAYGVIGETPFPLALVDDLPGLGKHSVYRNPFVELINTPELWFLEPALAGMVSLDAVDFDDLERLSGFEVICRSALLGSERRLASERAKERT